MNAPVAWQWSPPVYTTLQGLKVQTEDELQVNDATREGVKRRRNGDLGRDDTKQSGGCPLLRASPRCGWLHPAPQRTVRRPRDKCGPGIVEQRSRGIAGQDGGPGIVGEVQSRHCGTGQRRWDRGRSAVEASISTYLDNEAATRSSGTMALGIMGCECDDDDVPPFLRRRWCWPSIETTTASRRPQHPDAHSIQTPTASRRPQHPDAHLQPIDKTFHALQPLGLRNCCGNNTNAQALSYTYRTGRCRCCIPIPTCLQPPIDILRTQPNHSVLALFYPPPEPEMLGSLASSGMDATFTRRTARSTAQPFAVGLSTQGPSLTFISCRAYPKRIRAAAESHQRLREARTAKQL
ncbi:hypothetical protein PMIN01_12581 [Paraphaeosphaeria minitans]|uniref:Uncharacterized protein n=1 Tax=Paraphaeosphaeria minitans TaxID=565426 RepID=A0A9P6G6F2_9PLEO|nr:hypothetical protein PMIN01_12581 [Paraphaeosphaeria minitans]